MLPTIEVPSYETCLISTKEKVTYRPFLVKEHKILMTMQKADESEVTRMLKQLIDACTLGKLDVDKLPYFDIEWLFMQIRSKSIGEVVDANVNCKCGNKIKTSYNIEDLQVVQGDNHTNKIDLDGNCGVIMKYPSIDDAIKVFESDSDVESANDIVLSNIESIYTKKDFWDAKDLERQDLQDFVDNLPKEQFDKIENFFKTSPKIVQNINVNCDKCETDIHIKLQGLYNFFV